MECLRPTPADEIRAHIDERDLSRDTIVDFDFSGLELYDVHAQKTRFIRCTFRGTDLSYGDFGGTLASGCDFREAVLIKAVFYRAHLRGARFDGANLARSQFIYCDLRETSFAGAKLSGAIIADCNTEGMDLEGALSLTTAHIERG